MGNSQKWTILYIIVGIALALGINNGMAYAMATDLPIVAVESNSMVPTFYQGDILIIQGVPTDQLQIGDIIVFSIQNQATPIVHRIIKIHDDGTFQTKGDNKETNKQSAPFEQNIQPSQIHGKKVLIIPYLGWVKIAVVDYVLPNMLWFIGIIVGIAFIYLIALKNKNR